MADEHPEIDAGTIENEAREEMSIEEAWEGVSAEAREAVMKLLQIPDDATVQMRMVAILGELPAIGKTQRNTQQNFDYRGHDDVLNALNPLLAKHGVFIVPNVVERVTGERTTSGGKTMYEVNLHVAYTFHGAAGDSITASAWGEGTDMGDKATSKAMTAAFKQVIAQSFAISTEEFQDVDATSPEETTRGSGGGTQQRQRQSGEARPFDPGRDFIPGAIRVANEDDAVSIRQAQAELVPGEDWPAVEDFLCQHVWQKPYDELDVPQKREFWTRLANAVVRAGEAGGSGDFPPVPVEAVKEAYAYCFKGAVLALRADVSPSEDVVEAQASLDEDAS